MYAVEADMVAIYQMDTPCGRLAYRDSFQVHTVRAPQADCPPRLPFPFRQLQLPQQHTVGINSPLSRDGNRMKVFLFFLPGIKQTGVANLFPPFKPAGNKGKILQAAASQEPSSI